MKRDALTSVEPYFFMVNPEFKEFSRLARSATLVPVVKSVSADLLTPVSAFPGHRGKKSRMRFCWNRLSVASRLADTRFWSAALHAAAGARLCHRNSTRTAA